MRSLTWNLSAGPPRRPVRNQSAHLCTRDRNVISQREACANKSRGRKLLTRDARTCEMPRHWLPVSGSDRDRASTEVSSPVSNVRIPHLDPASVIGFKMSAHRFRAYRTPGRFLRRRWVNELKLIGVLAAHPCKLGVSLHVSIVAQRHAPAAGQSGSERAHVERDHRDEGLQHSPGEAQIAPIL